MTVGCKSHSVNSEIIPENAAVIKVISAQPGNMIASQITGQGLKEELEKYVVDTENDSSYSVYVDPSEINHPILLEQRYANEYWFTILHRPVKKDSTYYVPAMNQESTVEAEMYWRYKHGTEDDMHLADVNLTVSNLSAAVLYGDLDKMEKVFKYLNEAGAIREKYYSEIPDEAQSASTEHLYKQLETARIRDIKRVASETVGADSLYADDIVQSYVKSGLSLDEGAEVIKLFYVGYKDRMKRENFDSVMEEDIVHQYGYVSGLMLTRMVNDMVNDLPVTADAGISIQRSGTQLLRELMESAGDLSNYGIYGRYRDSVYDLISTIEGINTEKVQRMHREIFDEKKGGPAIFLQNATESHLSPHQSVKELNEFNRAVKNIVDGELNLADKDIQEIVIRLIQVCNLASILN